MDPLVQIASSICCLVPPSHYSLKDVFVPYCMDPRHPRDTLFLYIESDFRFHQVQDLPVAEWVGLVCEDPSGGEPSGARRPEESESGAPRPEGTKRKQVPTEPRRLVGDMFTQIKGYEREGWMRDEVTDVVGACNRAAALDRGDLVWLSWNGGDTQDITKKRKRTTHISFGSQLMGFTRQGLTKIANALRRMGSGHIDLQIKSAIMENQEIRDRSCYVLPPFGGFSDKHVSMNLAGAHRPAPWGASWSRGGTNPYNATFGKDVSWLRQLVEFVTKGQPPRVEDLDLPPKTRDFLWRTLAPPGMARDRPTEDERCDEMLVQRGWVDGGKRWVGPFWQLMPRWWHEPEAKARGRGQWKGYTLSRWWQLQSLDEKDYWRQLQEGPLKRMVNSRGEPLGGLTRLDYELVTNEVDPHWQANLSDGRKRALRAARLAYCQRYFWEGPPEQALRGGFPLWHFL